MFDTLIKPSYDALKYGSEIHNYIRNNRIN